MKEKQVYKIPKKKKQAATYKHKSQLSVEDLLGVSN